MRRNHLDRSARSAITLLTAAVFTFGLPTFSSRAFAQADAEAELPALDEEPMLDPGAEEAPAAPAPTESAQPSATPAPEAPAAAATATETAAPVDAAAPAAEVQTTEATAPAAAPTPSQTEVQTSEAAEAEVAAEPAPTPIPTNADGIVVDPMEAQFKDEDAPAVAADSKALEESGLSNEVVKNPKFPRPLLFAPEDNGLKLEHPQIKWEMIGGSRINMGGLKMQSAQIKFTVDQTTRVVDGKSRTGTNVSFAWPTVLTDKGVLTIESGDQKVKWRQAVTPAKALTWKTILKNRPDLKNHAGSIWGISSATGSLLKALSAGGNFRMCLVRKASKLEQLRVCSGYVNLKNVSGRFDVTQLRPKAEANVYIANKPAGPRGLLNFPPGRAVRMRVSFSDGSKVEIASQPASLSLLDVVESKDGKEIVLTGRQLMPLGKKKIISRPATHFWSATGIEQDTVWQIAIPQEAATVRVLGTFNLPFTFVFNYEKLPKETDRVYIRQQTSDGTYSDRPLLYGFSPNDDFVNSKEREATNTEPNKFEWRFNAPEIGDFNDSRITIRDRKDQSKQWVAHHRLFRGRPYEASSRLTGILTASGQTVVLGEVSGGAWFESLGFTQNDYVSRQRWGLAARHFRSLTAIDIGNGVSIQEFTATNVDLKYNVYRGIWNRDELVGLIGSTQSVAINGISSNLFGVGAYWARTMPKVFSDLFDLVPYLDYSKYVDMEFIMYPMATDANIVAGNSFSLNFHGKVFWTKRIYGEMGFGMKRYEYGDKKKNSSLAFAALYGTLGLGAIF